MWLVGWLVGTAVDFLITFYTIRVIALNTLVQIVFSRIQSKTNPGKVVERCIAILLLHLKTNNSLVSRIALANLLAIHAVIDNFKSVNPHIVSIIAIVISIYLIVPLSLLGDVESAQS